MQYVRIPVSCDHRLNDEKGSQPSEHKGQVENDVHTGRPGLRRRPGPYLKRYSADPEENRQPEQDQKGDWTKHQLQKNQTHGD